MVEVLKQGPYAPIPIEKQVIMIFAGNSGILDDIEVSAINKFEAELYPFMDAKYSSVIDSIKENKKITDENNTDLTKALEDFKESFSA
jgi:F-type H+-transporting ATPase subunit alpha